MTNKQYILEPKKEYCGNCNHSFTSYTDTVNTYCQIGKKEVRYYQRNCIFIPTKYTPKHDE